MSELFLYFFNTAIMAGWLVLAVLIARLLLKKAPAWAKCALWAIVGLRLVWPFEIESILSLIPSAQTLPPEALYDPAPVIHTGVNVLNSTINPTFTQTFQPEPATSINPLQIVVAVASVVWVVGIIAMAAYAAVSYLRLRRRVRVSMPAGEGVYLCDGICSPFILGLIKPKIYLPSDLPKEKWDSILAHERAHLARRDHWWKPLGFLLLTVFWFHPLLWLAYILLCRDVELACDEKVIKSLSADEKQAYSETLLECSVPKKWITACPLAFGETGVKQRIKAVLHYKKPTLWIIIAALIACAVLAVCFLTEPTDQPDEPPVITADDVAGKQYVYTKPGAGSAFYINIYADGTFQYYAGNYSSHIGLGNWELTDGKLYLHDDTLTDPMTFVFSVHEDALAYIAAESHPFMYVDVADGDRFVMAIDLPQSNLLSRSDIAGKHFVGMYERTAGDNAYQDACSFTFYEDGSCGFCTSLFDNCSSAVVFQPAAGTWYIEEDKLIVSHETAEGISALGTFRMGEDGALYVHDTFLGIPEDTKLELMQDWETENTLSRTDVAGRSLICHYDLELEHGVIQDMCTIGLNEDGTCLVSTSILSSQIHSGTWYVEDDTLYIQYDRNGLDAGHIFRRSEEGLFCSWDKESDSFFSNGWKFELSDYTYTYTPTQKNTVWLTPHPTISAGYGVDSDGNIWYITMQSGQPVPAMPIEGFWISYYGEPTVTGTHNGKITYSVTAADCWSRVDDESLRGRENVVGWVYDVCHYDYDNDGVLEECILSMGHSSGVSTVYFSTWQDGECERGFWISIEHAPGYAFVTDNNGLSILTSSGNTYAVISYYDVVP